MSLVYISGITKDENALRFEQVSKYLEQNGHHPVNPMNYKKSLQMKIGHKPSSEQFFKSKIEKLLECDSIYYISEKTDNEVILERNVAEAAGILELEILKV